MKLAVLALASFGASCGTSPPQWFPDAGDCVAYVVPSDLDLTSPVISFKSQIMGVLNSNCGSNMCHGSPSAPTEGMFLGDSGMQGADSDAAYAQIVGVTSNEDASMMRIVAGSPQSSYLMHKLDGDQCLFAASCGGMGCQDTMPMGFEMSVDERDTIRRWIAQGAQNN
jgi:hypothetical protein